MGPKKEPEVLDENVWRTIIEEAPLDEENWQVKVIIIEAAGSDQDRIYLNKFETFAAEEKRFVIKNICKTETVFMINQLGSEKKVKDESLRVFEEGNAYLKEKKDIPPDIFALVIKHLILKMKEEYLFIMRQRLEVKQGIRRESATMINKAEVKGTVSGVSVMPKEPVPPPDPAPAKGPIQIPEVPEGKKYNTSLRERGEEWRDKVYVQDYPSDGPNLYVAITGFVEPYLPGSLLKVGIPVVSVVQIRIDPNTTKVPSSLSRATKRGQSQTELLADLSLNFWSTLQMLRIQEESADVFKNTTFMVFSPPYWDNDDLSGEPEKIYDELCYLMYDIQDLSRQHIHYLENMDIINIPEEEGNARYLKFYHQLIDDLPLECVTIYSVLDSILGTVSLCQESDDSETSSSTVVETPLDIANDNLKSSEDLVKDVFDALCKTEGTKKYRLTYGDEYESHKDPVVINYGDDAKCKTFHLKNIILDQIVYSSLLGMPVHNLWRIQDRPTGEHEAKVNFHVNVLLSCFEREDIETSELNRLLHILACRKLYNNRSSLKKHHIQPTTILDFKKVYLKRSVLAEPLPTCPSIVHSNTMSPSLASMTKTVNNCEPTFTVAEDPGVQRLKMLFDCPDISELVSAAEIANNQPIKHMIDDFEYFEDFSGISAFQIMSEAFNKFNCVDYKYCEVTDCFILMFFNSHDKDGIARDEWRSHLDTPLCFQDFFDFILEEQYEWIQNEEKLYDEDILLKDKSESKDVIDPTALKSCVEDTEVETDLLMEGSLKHQELIQLEEASQDVTESTEPLSKKSTTSQATVEDKLNKKAKSPAVLSQKIEESSISIEMPPKPFFGYDLEDRRVEVFGKDATFFSKDGTRISSMYSLIIPMNLEYIMLNVAPGNSYNEFWVHKSLGEFVRPEIVDSAESFRVTTKDKVMINIKKQIYQLPIQLTATSTLENVDKQPSNIFSVLQLVYEMKHFYSLYITWPNGMITETVHEENSSVISHIKQYHVCPMPNLDEEMRCISLNGEVIIFKASGEIEILRPDGSYIKVTKCRKRLVVPDNFDEQTEDTSEKSKKGKGKDIKDKGKASKTSSKSLKNISEDEKNFEEKKLEYELVIEEFETIETSGLKQQYLNEIPFEIGKLLIRTATDHVLGEIFSRRMDGTSILLNKDGVLLVTFPNKTRIITYYIIDDEEIYPEWTEEEKEYFGLSGYEVESINSRSSTSQRSESDSHSSKKVEEEEDSEKKLDGYVSVHIIYTVEHSNFSTVTINKFTEKISIDSPNESKVVVDKDNNYSITLDSVTTAYFNGENLNISYEACPECKSFTNCNVKIKPAQNSETSVSDTWVQVSDSFNKHIVVNHEGSLVLHDESSSMDGDHPEDQQPDSQLLPESETGNENTDDKIVGHDGKSEISFASHGRCGEMYSAKATRFFVLRRELTVSELVHRVLLERYQRACRWQPWCSINRYNTFGDHRSLVSILTPIHLTESEKWLMESKLADKPQYLAYKDLKKDPGKGFYHWMRPYGRFVPKPIKPDNVLPPRLPRAYVLRTLEHQWEDAKRDELKGAQELLKAILRYRVLMEGDNEVIMNVPIIDPRPEEEKQLDEVVQSLAHEFVITSVYEELREQLTHDVETRAKASITTKPAPPESEEVSVEGEYEEESTLETAEEEQDSVLKQMNQAEEMSPALARYWRRRAEEFKEEEFYKYLLREGVVPPYFRNVLGGAIWWEMNNTAGEAVTKAERRKMMCICAEDRKTKPSDEVSSTGYTVSGPFL